MKDLNKVTILKGKSGKKYTFSLFSFDNFEELSDELKNRNYKCLISTKPAPTNKSKETRIFEVAPDIRECMIFVDDGNRDKAYSLFMTNVYSFKIMGKNKHDDAPDSLAMAIDMVRHRIQKIKAVNRPF